ncbi:hypothetical protein Tco_1502394 [Tanacetum coccineum]
MVAYFLDSCNLRTRIVDFDDTPIVIDKHVRAVTFAFHKRETVATSFSVGNVGLATDIVRLVCRWWNLSWTPLGSYADWLNWFNSIRLSSKVKDLLEGVLYITWWSVWMFRNQLLFSSKAPRKDVIFDDIVSRSFTWYLSRCGSSLETREICDVYLTEKELHQLYLDEEALREILEEKTMDEKARDEKIKQKQADDEEFFLEFGVVRYDSDYESSD